MPTGGGGFHLSWAGWSTFINYASAIATTVAVSTAWIPGVGEVTGGVVLVTDAASAITNGINAAHALRARDYDTFGWDLGSTIFAIGGVGAAGTRQSRSCGLR
jgi:hypothetical protein